mmetsp:Transcript_68738/g.136186  ORF Transcript_68738/g.136186 Transcript_68738/m.136186 type:complete len:223 (+) Transcript_68738:1357-2025(+)
MSIAEASPRRCIPHLRTTPQRSQRAAEATLAQLHHAEACMAHPIAGVRGSAKPMLGTAAISRHPMRAGVIEVAHVNLPCWIADVGTVVEVLDGLCIHALSRRHRLGKQGQVVCLGRVRLLDCEPPAIVKSRDSNLCGLLIERCTVRTALTHANPIGMPKAKRHATQGRTTASSAVIKDAAMRTICAERAEVVQVAQHIRGVQETHHGLRVRLSKFLSAGEPV